MKEINFSGNRVFYTSINTVMILSIISYPVEFKTQIISNNASANATTVFFTTSSTKQNGEDSDLGHPSNRVSGKGRNPCSELLISLVPGIGNIDPENTCNIESEANLAYTSSAYLPTVWVYIPKSKTINAKFVLIDNKRSIAQYSCSFQKNPGIVGFRFPVYKLEAGNVYRWSFSILKTQRPTENPTVGGKITLDSKAINPWHDRISYLADARLKADNPNLKSQWSNLLDSVGLGKISDFSLVGYGSCQRIN